MASFLSTGSFSLTSGDSDSLDFTFPFDITGYEIFFSAKTNPSVSDDCASIYKTQTSHSNAVAGQTSISLVPSDTLNLDSGRYFFDVRTKDFTGNITTWANDSFFLVSPITQNTISR